MSQNKMIKVWGVLDGPLEGNNEWHLLVKAEKNSKVGPLELTVPDFNEAYEIVKYFHYNIEPLVLKDTLDGEIGENPIPYEERTH